MQLERKKNRLFDLDFDNLTMGEAVDLIADGLAANRVRAMVATPNVDHLVKLERDARLRESYSKAEVVLADGAPIIAASRLLGSPLKDRVAGSDLLLSICERARDRGLRVLLLGGGEGVAEQAARNLGARFPGLSIFSHGPSFGFDDKPEENARVIALINELKPHLLFVALGAPRQEHWIARYQDSYGPCVSVGVGGSLDFAAGRIKRAPVILRKMGLEWLFRLAMEPRRLSHRYLVEDPRFLTLFIMEWKARRRLRRLASGSRAAPVTKRSSREGP
jgi:N-acetylglucosaminyldiphosphoundecaprenol N-acetyl-beta-D-mannosaminyltransferase